MKVDSAIPLQNLSESPQNFSTGTPTLISSSLTKYQGIKGEISADKTADPTNNELAFSRKQSSEKEAENVSDPAYDLVDKQGSKQVIEQDVSHELNFKLNVAKEDFIEIADEMIFNYFQDVGFSGYSLNNLKTQHLLSYSLLYNDVFASDWLYNFNQYYPYQIYLLANTQFFLKGNLG